MSKIRRPSAQDHIDADLALGAYGDRIPTKDEFIHDMKEQWDNYFTEAEKTGVGSSYPAPITFSYYLRLSRVALMAQIKEVIPAKMEKGLLTIVAGRRNIDLIKKLVEYEDETIGQLGGR